MLRVLCVYVVLPLMLILHTKNDGVLLVTLHTKNDGVLLVTLHTKNDDVLLVILRKENNVGMLLSVSDACLFTPPVHLNAWIKRENTTHYIFFFLFVLGCSRK